MPLLLLVWWGATEPKGDASGAHYFAQKRAPPDVRAASISSAPVISAPKSGPIDRRRVRPMCLRRATMPTGRYPLRFPKTQPSAASFPRLLPSTPDKTGLKCDFNTDFQHGPLTREGFVRRRSRRKGVRSAISIHPAPCDRPLATLCECAPKEEGNARSEGGAPTRKFVSQASERRLCWHIGCDTRRGIPFPDPGAAASDRAGSRSRGSRFAGARHERGGRIGAGAIATIVDDVGGCRIAGGVHGQGHVHPLGRRRQGHREREQEGVPHVPRGPAPGFAASRI